MIRTGKKALIAWIFAYAGLISAAMLVARPGTAASQNTVNLSPVEISEDAPALRFDPITRRSDI